MSDKIQLIALRMRDLREISGMSAEEVAEKSGVNADVYKEYESGTRDFSFSHLFNIAETLGVDISDLLTGESPRLRGYELTIRLEDAAKITVEPVQDAGSGEADK